MRLAVGGCVAKSLAAVSALKGSMMNRLFCAGFGCSSGMRFEYPSSLRRALMSPSGEPTMAAASASATNSRLRLIAALISAAPTAATMNTTIITSGFAPCRRSPIISRNPQCESIASTPAIVAAIQLVSVSRFLMCASSWATTPAISSRSMSSIAPCVNATAAFRGLRPVAKAFGAACGHRYTFGIGRPARWLSSWTVR